MKKSAKRSHPEGVTGLAWWYGCPQPSYSAADVVRIFSDQWEAAQALVNIRAALRRGELHAFRVGVTNRFPRPEVVAFVARYHAMTGTEKAVAACASGFADLCIPATDLINMLTTVARSGFVAPLEELLETGAVGKRTNAKYPASNADAYMKTPADVSDAVPGLRTRIKINSQRTRRRKASRKPAAGAHDE